MFPVSDAQTGWNSTSGRTFRMDSAQSDLYSSIALAASNEQENLRDFRQMVLADRALHEQLRATSNEGEFIELAVRLAIERGCPITASALQAAVAQKRRDWLERWL
jgi:hypothetical protein